MNSEQKQTAVYSFGHFANDLGANTLSTLLPKLSVLLNLTNTLGGIMISSFQMTAALLQLLFGYLVDKSPKRWFAPLGLMMCSGFMALVGILPSFANLLILAVISGTGSALFHPSSTSMVSFPNSRRRGTLISIFLLGGNMGFAVGPIVVAGLIGLFDLSGTMLLMIPGVIGFVLISKFAPKMHAPPMNRDIGRLFTRVKARSRLIIPLTFALFIRGSVTLALQGFLPTYAVKELGMDLLSGGAMLFAMLISFALGAVVGGVLGDKYGSKKILVISLLIATPLIYAFVSSTGVFTWIYASAIGLALGLSTSITIVWMHQILPENMGLASALNLGVTLGFGGISIALTGVAIDTLGFQRTFEILATLPLIGGAAAQIFLPKIK